MVVIGVMIIIRIMFIMFSGLFWLLLNRNVKFVNMEIVLVIVVVIVMISVLWFFICVSLWVIMLVIFFGDSMLRRFVVVVMVVFCGFWLVVKVFGCGLLMM